MKFLTRLDLCVYGLHLPAEAEPLQHVVEAGRGEEEAEVEAGPAPGPGLRPRVETGEAAPSQSEVSVVSSANRLIGEVVQSRRSPLLGPSPG